MTVYNTGGSTRLAVKHVFPVEVYQEKISQQLIEAAHVNDLKSALECLKDPFIDVNFIGTVCLNSKKTEIVLHDESPSEVRVELEEFKTNVTALFVAAHVGNVSLVRKLLVIYINRFLLKLYLLLFISISSLKHINNLVWMKI